MPAFYMLIKNARLQRLCAARYGQVFGKRSLKGHLVKNTKLLSTNWSPEPNLKNGARPKSLKSRTTKINDMKKFLFFLISWVILILFIESCSKSNSDNPTPNTKQYRLSKKTFDNGHSENYYYNENGQLRKLSHSDGYVREFIYDTEGRLIKVTGTENNYSESYHFQNDLLSYISFSSSGHMEEPDTAFFIYDNTKRISQKINSYLFDNISLRVTTNYFYDDNNKLVKSITINTENAYPSYDTITYQWNSEDNLVKMRHINYVSNGPNSYNQTLDEQTYEYDNYLNFNKTIPYPTSYLLYHNYYRGAADEIVSKNNVIEIDYKTLFGSYVRTYLVTEHQDNLPTRIVGEYESWSMIYEEII